MSDSDSQKSYISVDLKKQLHLKTTIRNEKIIIKLLDQPKQKFQLYML